MGDALNDSLHGLDAPQFFPHKERIYFIHLQKEGSNRVVTVYLIDDRLLNASHTSLR